MSLMLFGCAHVFDDPVIKIKQYSSAAIALSDFSMKIIAHYESQGLSVPIDFNTHQFISILENVYPDQKRVKEIQDKYKISVRSLDNGYSVMLCDPQTNVKIMEDISCHLNYVEIHSWKNPSSTPCVFEDNWKPYCQY
jgi:hypothetical protein